MSNNQYRILKSPQNRSRYRTADLDESSENVNDDMDEKSVSNKGKPDTYKSKINTFKVVNEKYRKAPLDKSESEELRREILNLRNENKLVLDHLKQIKVDYALSLESKSENEQSLLNEIRILNNRLGGEGRGTDVDYESRSQYDRETFNLDEIRRESYSKPLSEFAESTSSVFGYTMRSPIRRRDYNK